VPTVATIAFLAVRSGTSQLLVSEALGAIYEEGMQLQFPALIRRADAMRWVPMRMHPVARRYFNPEDELGRMANIMESLAAMKELIVALAAGSYLVWDRWRRWKEQEKESTLRLQKDRLDELLQKTLRIERAQMKTADPGELREFLDAVTEIKLEALQDFTDEGLRGDRSFSIFLTQCANLMNKIQFKILSGGRGQGGPSDR
jgi:hypothetical protein